MKRVLFWAVIGFAVLFALQGGEYSTVDLIRQRSRARMLARAIDSLQRDVDSLSKLKRRILTDPILQERIAREEYGMVRDDHELLYRFTDADSARKPRR